MKVLFSAHIQDVSTWCRQPDDHSTALSNPVSGPIYGVLVPPVPSTSGTCAPVAPFSATVTRPWRLRGQRLSVRADSGDDLSHPLKRDIAAHKLVAEDKAWRATDRQLLRQRAI